MRRREALSSLLVAVSLPVVAAQAQQAQPGRREPLSEREKAHIDETMKAGSISLETSRLAQTKARHPEVKRFAQLESAEQETIGAILKMRAGMPEGQSPSLPPDGKAMVDRLQGLKDAAFDKAYLDIQLDGHQKLLAIQEKYLSGGQDELERVIAMMARGHIKEHLSDLDVIRKEVSA